MAAGVKLRGVPYEHPCGIAFTVQNKLIEDVLS